MPETMTTSPLSPSEPLPPIEEDLLRPYTVKSPLTSSPRLPPLSRVDPQLTQREAPATLSDGGLIAWGRKNFWDIGWFLGRKGWDLTWAIVRYGIKGPPKPSWGIEMTVIAAIMRNIGEHSALADITLVRQLISIHHLLPLPPDAIVTPISFVVKKRSEPLRGFFRDLDLQETGARELSGEWVVGKSVWKRLKLERKRRKLSESRGSASASSNRVQPVSHSGSQSHSINEPGPSRSRTSNARQLSQEAGQSRKKSRAEKVIYYIHGGAYYVGGATTHRTITIALSKACDARVFALNYRLAPEDRFPLGLLDIVVGDSAGGGLCLAMTMYLRDEGYTDRMPRGLILLSPWVDLTMSCGSWDENAPYDIVPQPGKGDHLNPVSCYLGPEGIKKYLTHPYASPLFGDLSHLPPMLIQGGDAEVLRDEITLLAHKATVAGTKVKHELYTDQVHVFQSFPFLEATTVSFKSIGKFVAHLRAQHGGAQDHKPRPTARDELTSLPAAMVDRDARSMTPSGGVDTVGQEMQHGRTRLVRGDGTEVDIVNISDDDGIGEVAAAEEVESLNPDLPKSGVQAVAADAHQDRPVSNVPTTPTKPLVRRALSSLGRGFTSPSAGSSSAITSAHRRPSGIPFFRNTSTMPDDEDFDSELDAEGEAAPAASSSAGPSSPRSSESGRSRPPRRPTISSTLTFTPARPTTRHRSQSHSDMVSLVEGYGARGPANRTVVFTPMRERPRGVDNDDDGFFGGGAGVGARDQDGIIDIEGDDVNVGSVDEPTSATSDHTGSKPTSTLGLSL